MGYRVSYQDVKKMHRMHKRKTGKLALIGILFLAVLLLLSAYWPRSASILREALVPGDTAVTTAAFETFTQQVRQGMGLGEAFRNFCQTVLQEGAVVTG